MDDRELLEMAAKAAGYDVVRMDDEEEGLLLYGKQYSWNPLADDGEALRLAVKLRMEVDINRETVWASSHETLAVGNAIQASNDPYSATRRAIVLAAAEVWKGM